MGTAAWALWGSEVSQKFPGAQPDEGSGAKATEAKYAYTICR